MAQLPNASRGRTVTLIWLAISQLMAVASLWLWLLAAGFSVMAFDQGDSPEARRFVLIVLSYPLFPLLMGIGAWVAFAHRRHRLAAILSGLTFAPAALLYLALQLGI